MNTFNTIAVLISLAAGFAYLNHRFFRMPMTIGLMVLSLAMAVAFIALEGMGLPMARFADKLVSSVDFSQVLLNGMLGLLLFAGALHVKLDDLADQALEVGIFATIGVAISTLLVGTAVYYLSRLLGLELTFIHCLLFGALISPTDPIAVLAIMKKAAAPKSLSTKITGESLFNDGMGVVVFLVILEIAVGGHHLTGQDILVLFAEEVLGGVAFGLLAGYLAYRILKSVDNYQVEIMVTLALVVGGYALANALHLSGPLAMVAAGLLIGNRGRRLAMSSHTRENLDKFWELVDEILNALLFVLIGLEVLLVTFRPEFLWAASGAVVVTLLARFMSVGIPVGILRRWRYAVPHAATVMTWGGLRGGISVALALTLPVEAGREPILAMTYGVVVFSIIVQGLSIKWLVTKVCSEGFPMEEIPQVEEKKEE